MQSHSTHPHAVNCFNVLLWATVREVFWWNSIEHQTTCHHNMLACILVVFPYIVSPYLPVNVVQYNRETLSLPSKFNGKVKEILPISSSKEYLDGSRQSLCFWNLFIALKKWKQKQVKGKKIEFSLRFPLLNTASTLYIESGYNLPYHLQIIW